MEAMNAMPSNNDQNDQKNNTAYDIEYLLDRAYDSFTLDKGRVKLVRPKVHNKDRKGYILNFQSVCAAINRTPEAVQKRLEKELQIVTSIKEDGRLKIDKSVKSSLVEGLVKDYIMDHIMCKSCKSVKTRVEKTNRIEFLICDTCRCRVAVSSR